MNAFSPNVDLAELHARLARLRRARRALLERSPRSVLDVLDRVMEEWLDAASPWRRQCEALLPAATGFSPEMIRRGLPLMLEPLRPPALRRLLAAELGADFVAGARPERSPALIVHVLAGNLPAQAVLPMVLSLALRSAALVKTASGDRVSPELFARSLAAADALLGTAVTTCYWRGGDRAMEDAALGAAGLVVASGSDAAIADLRSRARSRFIGHGHRVSFAFVAREIARDSAARRAAARALAHDVSLWDQRGCLSAQLCFVEGELDDAHEFAAALTPELTRLAHELPPGRKSLEEIAAIRRFRDEAEWQQPSGRRCVLLCSPAGTDWTIRVEGEAVFRPTPLGRSLRIMPVASANHLAAVLAPASALLEAAGVAAPPPRMEPIAGILQEAGVHWVCALGRMQEPPLEWPQGGRPRVADWCTP